MPIKNKKWKNLIALIVGFTGIVFVFEIIPRLMDTGSLVIEWIEQADQIEKMDELNIKSKELTIHNRSLKAEINSFVSDYEENQKISSVLKLMHEIASKTKVHVESIKPGKISKRNNLWLQPMEIKVNSKYENYYNFIRFLENSQKVILVKNILANSDKDKIGRINFNTQIEVYLNL